MINKNRNYILGNYEINLIILISIFILILKYIYSNNILAIILTSIFEFLNILLLLLLLLFLQRKLKLISNLFLFLIFYLILIFDTIINIMHSYFLDEVLILKYNLINFDKEIILYFLTTILPIKIIIISLIFFIILIFISRKIDIKKLTLNLFYSHIFFIIFLYLLIGIVIGAFFSNPYINTVIGTYNKCRTNELEVVSYSTTNYNFSQFNKNRLDFKTKINNQRILIFIMESVPYKDFINFESVGFFKQIRNNSHIYTNYYTSNQDSLTSILSILSSQFIPYDAYSLNWKETYGDKIFNSKNLVEDFNQKNYKTIFISSSYSKIDFIEAFNWSSIIYLTNESKKQNFICLEKFGNENACEDMAIFDDLKNEIIKNKNLFLVQELIFGHGIEYNTILNKKNIEYYNEYFGKVYSFLEDENLLENTTIIITSDHSLRNNKELENKDKYQIPLIIYNKNYNFKIKDYLLNHIDFKNILISELNHKNLDERKEIFYIGQTRSSIIGYYNKSGSSFSIIEKDNSKVNLLNYNNMTIDQVLEKIFYFKEYRNFFVNK